MSGLYLAPKEDYVENDYGDKAVEGVKTRMGRIYQKIVIWRPLKHLSKSRTFWAVFIEESLDLVLSDLFVMS